MVTTPNHPRIGREGRRIVSDGTFQPVAGIRKLVDFLVKLTQKLAAPGGRWREKLFQHGKLPERFAQRNQLARSCKSQSNAASEPFEVKDPLEFLADFAAHNRLLDEVSDGIEPGLNCLSFNQRAQDPGTQQARAHAG